MHDAWFQFWISFLSLIYNEISYYKKIHKQRISIIGPTIRENHTVNLMMLAIQSKQSVNNSSRYKTSIHIHLSPLGHHNKFKQKQRYGKQKKVIVYVKNIQNKVYKYKKYNWYAKFIKSYIQHCVKCINRNTNNKKYTKEIIRNTSIDVCDIIVTC